MKVLLASDHITIDPMGNKGIERVLEDHFKVPKLKKGYKLPKTLYVLRELIVAFPELRNNDLVMKEGKLLRERQDYLLQLRSSKPQIDVGDLRPYQIEDVNYLHALSQAGVFNEPRTGKTPTMIALIRILHTKRNLIVVPASLLYNWKSEFEIFYGELPVVLADGNAAQRAAAYYSGKTVIVSKNVIARDLKNNALRTLTWDFILVDEAHFLRNYDTAQSKAVFALSSKAERRYALTGTPTVKSPADIYGILHFLFPKLYNSYWQFVERYFEVTQGWYSREVGKPLPYRETELQEIIGMVSISRKRVDIMPWLPPKQRTVIEVKMGKEQAKHYRQMLKFFNTKDEHGNEADAQNEAVRLMRLRQICQDPALLGLDAPSAKSEALIEYIENHPEPLIVMSWFTPHFDILKSKIKDRKIGFITGNETAKEKGAIAKAFQNGELDLLLCNTVSAGTGFTLDRSSCVIFLDRLWTPAEQEQAEDRVCPTIEGSNMRHEIVEIVCKDTVDEYIKTILDKRVDLTAILNKGGAEAIRKLLANMQA